MAIYLTGNDLDGVSTTSVQNTYITLEGQVLARDAGGAAFSSAHTLNTLVMRGTLYAAKNTVGVLLSAAGEITVHVAASGSIISSQAAIMTGDNLLNLVNEGSIFAMYGGILAKGPGSTVINHGTISNETYTAVSVGLGANITNSGTISASYGIGLLDNGGSYGAKIFNDGTILARNRAVDLGSNFVGSSLTNTGLIAGDPKAYSGAISGSYGDDTIHNFGEIVGDITLGYGNDLFVHGGGHIAGAIDLGRDDDTVVLEVVGPGDRFVLDGGAGLDMIDLSAFGNAIWFNMSSQRPEIWTRDGATVTTGDWRSIADARGFEKIIGTVGVDYLAGNDEDNWFGYMGTALNPGNETMLGFGGHDTADFSRFESAVWVNLESSTREAWTKDTDSVVGAGGTWRPIVEMQGIEDVVGTYGIDEFQGNAADNTFIYVGHHEAQAVLGTERFDGRGGSDTLDMSGFGRAVWVDLNSDVEVWTQDDYDTRDGGGNWRELVNLTSVENIIGTINHEVLRGNGVANIIEGGGGSDEMTGRGGNDTFVFGSRYGILDGTSRITDFSANDAEKIDLRHIAQITDFTDLLANHAAEDGGVLYIHDTIGRIFLDGYTLADIGVGLAISANDFLFAEP